MPDLLASGTEREPLRLPPLPRRTLAVLLSCLAVALAGLLSVPQVQAASAPPEVTATTSGGASGGRLRVWLLLDGPPSARLASVRADVPGNEAEVAVVPEAFSSAGFAVVRVDVDPRCPEAVAGLAEASLRVAIAGERVVRVPFDTSGPLEGGVRARCSGLDEGRQLRGPLVRAADGGPAGVVRTVVELGAPGPEVLLVRTVTPGPGLAVEVVTPLPLRVAPGRRAELVVDLRPGRCFLDPDEPPFVLDVAAQGDVDPVVEPGLARRLAGLRRTAC